MRQASNPRLNRLLASLPAADYRRLLSHLEPQPISPGDVLYEPDARLQYVHFPTAGIISLVHVTRDGSSVEISAVGNEGLVGIAVFLGGNSRPNRAVAQCNGFAYRLKANKLKDEFARGGALQKLLLRYTQLIITQKAQMAVCNRHHTLDQQLCRWLLMSLDRLGSNEVMMTQDLIANLLGVRRESVTEAARKLQLANVIRYTRGHITVVNREALEANVCECYEIVRREFDRLLPVATD